MEVRLANYSWLNQSLIGVTAVRLVRYPSKAEEVFNKSLKSSGIYANL